MRIRKFVSGRIGQVNVDGSGNSPRRGANHGIHRRNNCVQGFFKSKTCVFLILPVFLLSIVLLFSTTESLIRYKSNTASFGQLIDSIIEDAQHTSEDTKIRLENDVGIPDESARNARIGTGSDLKQSEKDDSIIATDKEGPNEIQIADVHDATNDEKDNIIISEPTNSNHIQNTEETKNMNTNSPFAYCFLVAGVIPEKPTYTGYLLNIAIANHILKKHNSKADVVVMVRMHLDTNATSLPPQDEKLLTSGGVIIKYIPPPITENFHTAMMDKFRILELTEYQRVLYFDADVMPLNNLDYMFELSVGPNPSLQENTVLTYHLEPANGGFFMLKPNQKDFQQISQIIERREMEGYDFNTTIGWGHIITPPDHWDCLKEQNKTEWSFYGAFTDQGLLFYWTKYVKKKVTILFGDKVRTYNENGVSGEVELVKEESAKTIFENVPPVGNVTAKHRNRILTHHIAPYKHFHHFVEKTKPWLDKKTANNPKYVDNPTNPTEFWLKSLLEINTKYNLDLRTDNIWYGKPSLGTFPANSMVKWAKESREQKTNQQNATSSSPGSAANIKDQQYEKISIKSTNMNDTSTLVDLEGNRFAYAFLVAGVEPEKPSYKGYIYNIAVAKDILKQRNSTADVVVMVRMHALSNSTSLPKEDEEILSKSGVIIKYIPPPLTDNFHTAMMDKFRILELTGYDRVIYLDSDVMPVNNIDYIFQKSVGPDAKLQENVVLQNHLEPASGGFFMLKPDKEDFAKVTDLIMKRQRQGYDFNETIGWGHIITEPDYWQSFSKRGNKWDFYGSFTDQGLLYYWTKYAKQKVSIISNTNVETWLGNDNGEVVKTREESSKDVFAEEVKQGIGLVVPRSRMSYIKVALPYRDFHHFIQKTKPWLNKEVAQKPIENVEYPKTPLELWCNTLVRIDSQYGLNINLKNIWNGRPSLGTFPTFKMVANAKAEKEMMEDELKEMKES